MNVPNNEDALISIGGLARASGVPVETLRNWERRYGFPEPKRLESGHRRYSWDVVPRVRLIRRALELGYKPSYAVVASVAELTEVIRETEPPAKSSAAGQAGSDEREIGEWIRAVERLDAPALELAFRRAWARVGATKFCLDLTVPFLREIGDRWEDGRLTVAHEHFASESLTTFLGNQWRPLSRRATGGKVVLANPEGEHHSLGLHIAAVFLSLSNIQVLFLGQNTPLADIVTAARRAGVLAVIIGLASSSDHERAIAYLVRLRDDLPATMVVAFGGNAQLDSPAGVTFFESFERFAEWSVSLAR